MKLPYSINENFKDKLLQFEQEKQMPYVTSIERFGLERGLKEGLNEGFKKGHLEGQNEGILLGKIKGLQIALGKQESTIDALLSLPKEELQALHNKLKAEI